MGRTLMLWGKSETMKTQAWKGFCLKTTTMVETDLWPIDRSQHLQQDQKKASKSSKGDNGDHEAGLEQLEKERKGGMWKSELGPLHSTWKKSQVEGRVSTSMNNSLERRGCHTWLYLVIGWGKEGKDYLWLTTQFCFELAGYSLFSIFCLLILWFQVFMCWIYRKISFLYIHHFPNFLLVLTLNFINIPKNYMSISLFQPWHLVSPVIYINIYLTI